MKLMKKTALILAAVCALVLCTILCAANVSATITGSYGSDLNWILFDNGELMITGKDEMLQKWANYGDRIISVEIDEGFTSICDSAFASCNKLTNVTIPASVASIGDNAFKDCTSLTNVKILSHNADFGIDVFQGSSFDFTIYGYEGSTAEVYAAEHGIVFVDIESLPETEAPELTVIESGYCGVNNAYQSITWTLYNNGELVVEGEGPMGSRRWSNYSNFIKNVTIGTGITSIGDSSFWGHGRLQGIFIPATVTDIGENAFHSCIALTTFTVDEENPIYSDLNGVLFNKDKTRLILYPIGKTEESYAIPSGVTSIGNSAFDSCKTLTSISIPASVTSIENSAFCRNRMRNYR